jgi:phage-related protein
VYLVEYYTENGKSPVFDFISSLNHKHQAKILREIDLLAEFGFSLGLPHIKSIKNSDGLWELRIKHSSNNFRILYFHYSQGKFVLLHGFKKTTSKTPKNDINIALKRMKNYLQRSE